MDKKIKEYLAKRARPLEEKTVTFKPTETCDYGLAESVTLISGKCPCTVCGHEWMLECEEADCQCCSSACT